MKNMRLTFWCVIVVLSSLTCTQRTHVEPCDFSYAISCASYYSDQDEFQKCLVTLGGSACELNAQELSDVNANISQDITSYTCSMANPVVRSLVDQNISVSHTPTDGSNVIYVDAFHSPLTEYKNFYVTYTIASAIEISTPQTKIILCPGSYLENVKISGENKNGLSLMNIAGGALDMAPYTQIKGELGSSIEIVQSKGISLKGLTLSGGQSGVLAGSGFGGGVYISSYLMATQPQDAFFIQNTKIESATALYDGGGLYADGTLDLNLDHVTFVNNRATFGRGGALALHDDDRDEKVLSCVACDFSQNSSELFGSVAFVTGNDVLMWKDTQVQNNLESSFATLAAIVLDDQAQFYGENIFWGENDSENQTADILLVQTWKSDVLRFGEETWEQIKNGELTEESWTVLQNSLLNDEGLMSGQFNYSQTQSVQCHMNSFSDSCGFQY